MMKTDNWKPFTLGDLFFIETGKDLIYYALTSGDFPVVGHKTENNGITAYTQRLDDTYPLYDNTQTIALADRGTFYATLQDRPFYIGTRVKALKPKFNANIYILSFLVTIINRESFRFCYGRNSCDRTKDIVIKLPAIERGKNDFIPDYVTMEHFMTNDILPILPQKTRNVLMGRYNKRPLLSSTIVLDIQTWGWVKMTNLFTSFEKCKCTNAVELLEEGDEIPYVGAKKMDNGIIKYVKKESELVTRGDCIVFIGQGEGSVGYCLYQPEEFIGSASLIVGYNEKLNPYNAQFLVTILDLERYRYSFGRSYNKDIVRNSRIKLPITISKEPDWDFMERYIKSLPYSTNIANDVTLTKKI